VLPVGKQVAILCMDPYGPVKGIKVVIDVSHVSRVYVLPVGKGVSVFRERERERKREREGSGAAGECETACAWPWR
jgi:hypothetical protein